MKKIKFILLSIVVLLLAQIGIASADIYIPSPTDDCKYSEEYFKEGTISQNDYEKIRSVTFDDKFSFIHEYQIGQKGFCVDREEYCSKNNCSLMMSLEKIGSTRFHINNVVVNLILNLVLIFLICLIARVGLKSFRKIGSFVRIVIITILGYLADFVAIFLALVIAGILWKIGVMNTAMWYKMDFAQLITQPLLLALTVIIAFILVFLIFYFLFSKVIAASRKKRIALSLVFGILSNPGWYVLYKLLTA